MKGDFSRQTFDSKKHYRGVMMQQGRVQLDSDMNEQQSIGQYYDESQAADSIGKNGVPRAYSNGNGFKIGIADGGSDLSISKGHAYVDGILCENDEENVTFKKQPDLPGASLPSESGICLVYLDVWHRCINALDDPDIREKALGGPDTTTRSKTVWQVKCQRVAEKGTKIECSSFDAAWKPYPAPTGKLVAKAETSPQDTGPCQMPKSSGYRSLENQLYRIEIHKGGPSDQATFKWSSENGSVEASIKSISGKIIVLDNLSRDSVLGFDTSHWVEIVTDKTELATDPSGQPSSLARPTFIHPSKPEITVNADQPAVSSDLHPKMRRWDQDLTKGDADGIPLNSGTWHDIEYGIKVKFDAGTYYSGDYWLIPARTAVTSETGSIEWPLDDTGKEPSSEPCHGIKHHYCPLALADFDGTVFALLQDSDCRQIFPPLTDITAADVKYKNTNCLPELVNARTVQDALDTLCKQNQGLCTILLVPGTKISADEILKKIGERKDVHLCFQTGTYIFDKALKLNDRETVKISGCGAGTKVSALESEVAIAVEKCTNVTVRELSAKGTITKKGDSLNGVLTFSGCEHIAVDSLTLSCAGSTGKRSSCITVRPANKGEQGSRSVRIRHSNFEVGDDQVGILLVNAQRAHVEDNVVCVVKGPTKPGITERLKDLTYRANLSNILVSNSKAGAVKTGEKPPPLDDKTNTRVVYGNYYVHFATSRMITDKSWAELIKEYPPEGEIKSARDLQVHIESLAERVLLDEGIRKRVKGFRSWFDSVANEIAPVGKQGIVMGGENAEEVRVINNTLEGFLQGIHIGLSHKESQPGTPDKAGFVTVTGNNIVVRFSPEAKYEERHGIFMGNCRSLMIENNHVVLERLKGAEKLNIEGIRVYGIIGQRMIIRHNHMEGFDSGILIDALPPYEKECLWLTVDNIASGAAHAVVTKNANVKRDDKSDYNVPV